MAQFTKGNSGNPAGKPQGSKDKRTELRLLFQPHAEQLIEKVVAMALGGDITALRLCLDRICPALKPQSEPLAVDVATSGTLTDQAASIYQSVVAGEISTDDATALITVLNGQARLVEIDETRKYVQDTLDKIEALQSGMPTLAHEHYKANSIKRR